MSWMRLVSILMLWCVWMMIEVSQTHNAVSHSYFLYLIIFAACSYNIFNSAADHWRVILKGEQPDYIHAVYVNVIISYSAGPDALLILDLYA